MDVACATYACNGRHVEANSTYIQQVHALNGHILCAGEVHLPIRELY